MVIVSRVLGKTGEKNLWDKTENALVQGNISSSTGEEQTGTTRLRTNGYIAVKPNTTYRINATGAATQCFIFEYADGYEYKSHYSGWQSLGVEYTTNTVTKYIRILFAKASGTITPDEVQSVSVVEV